MPRRRRILIVDADPDVLATLGLVFYSAGFAVHKAQDAEAARRQLLERKLDFAIVDWMLPGGVTGAELCEELKAARVRYVLMSGHPDIIMRAEEGLIPFVRKPFRSFKLVEMVRLLLERPGVEEA